MIPFNKLLMKSLMKNQLLEILIRKAIVKNSKHLRLYNNSSRLRILHHPVVENFNFYVNLNLSFKMKIFCIIF